MTDSERASAKNQTDLLSEIAELALCVRDAIETAAAEARPVDAVFVDKCMYEILNNIDRIEAWNADLTEKLLSLAR